MKKEEKLFYTVGEPILYTVARKSTKSGFFVKNTYRFSIDDEEILESFNNKQLINVKLFTTEEDAFFYSNFLCRKDQMNLLQPAVLKVLYKGEKDFETSRDKITFSISDAEQKKKYSFKYMNTDKDQLTLLSGQLNVFIPGEKERRVYSLTEQSVSNYKTQEQVMPVIETMNDEAQEQKEPSCWSQ